MAGVVVIERIAEPLPGDRAQLVETVFVDGAQELRTLRGSPAHRDKVRRHEETLTMDDRGVRVRRGS